MMHMRKSLKKLIQQSSGKKGIIYVWTNKNLKSRNLEIKVRNDLGIKQKLLNKKRFLKLEPNLILYLMQELFMRSNARKRSTWNFKKIFKFF